MASNTVKNSLDKVQCVSESSDSDLLQYKDKLAVQAKLPVCGSTQATGAQQVYASKTMTASVPPSRREGGTLAVCGSTQATGAQQVYALNLLQRTGKDPLRAGSYLLW